MAKLLPIGTYIRVVEPGEYARPPYVGVIVGYDMGRTKYELGLRYGGWGEWLFLKGGSWTFPSWTTEITEAEAKLIPQRPIADVSGDPINVAALNALCDAATPGPWEIADEIDGWRRGRRTVVKAGVPGGASRKRVVTVDQTRDHHDKDAEDNVAFIAAARTALPALLAEVERLQAALVATRKPAPDPEHPERLAAAHQVIEGLRARERERVRTAVVEALRYVRVNWISDTYLINDSGGRQIAEDLASAEELTRLWDMEPGWCCPFCEEVECDSDCPLARVRGELG